MFLKRLSLCVLISLISGCGGSKEDPSKDQVSKDPLTAEFENLVKTHDVSKLDNRLLEAAESGNMSVFSAYKDMEWAGKAKNLEGQYGNKGNLLHIAARSGQAQVVAFLLNLQKELKVELNVENKAFETPIEIATAYLNPQCVLLLKAWAYFNTTYGTTKINFLVYLAINAAISPELRPGREELEPRIVLTLDALKEIGVPSEAFSLNVLVDENGEEIINPDFGEMKDGKFVWYFADVQKKLQELSK